MQESIQTYLSLALAAFSVIYTVINNQNKSLREEIKSVREDLEKKADASGFAALLAKVNMIENAITRMDADMRHFPTKDSLYDIKLSIAQQESYLKAIASRVEQIAQKIEIPPAE